MPKKSNKKDIDAKGSVVDRELPEPVSPEPLPKGAKRLTTGRVQKFEKPGDMITGIYVHRKEIKKANSGDILVFEDPQTKERRQCWSSSQIDTTFEDFGIEPDGTRHLRIQLLEIVPIGRNKTFKNFDIVELES